MFTNFFQSDGMTPDFNDRLNSCVGEKAILSAVLLPISILADILSWPLALVANIQCSQEVTHALPAQNTAHYRDRRSRVDNTQQLEDVIG